MNRHAGPLIVAAFGLGFLPGTPFPGRARADADPADYRRAQTVEVYDLATLTPAQAGRLDGKRRRFRVVIDGLPVRLRRGDAWVVLPRGDAYGSLYVRAAPPEGDGEARVLTVEAKLEVVRHPARLNGPAIDPASTEYRLVDADWVGP